MRIIADSPESLEALPHAKRRLEQFTRTGLPINHKYMFGNTTVRIVYNPMAKLKKIELSGGDSPTYVFNTTDYATAFHPGGQKLHYTQVYNNIPAPTAVSPKARGSYSGLNGTEPTAMNDQDVRTVWKGCFNVGGYTSRAQYSTTPPPTGKVYDTVDYTTIASDCRPDHCAPYYVDSLSGFFASGSTSIVFDQGDVGWDVRQKVYKNGKAQKTITVDLPAPRWWRRGTTCTKDGVLISIVTDSYNNFYFFRTDSEPTSDDVTNWVTLTTHGYIYYIPEGKCIVKTWDSIKPSWAAEATHETLTGSTSNVQRGIGPSGQYNILSEPIIAAPLTPVAPGVPVFGTSLPRGETWEATGIPQGAYFQSNQSLWNFNRDGTKVVGIVGYDRGVEQFQSYTYAPLTGIFTFNAAEDAWRWRWSNKNYGAILSSTVANSRPEFGPALSKVITPALVEFNIDITLTSLGVISNVNMTIATEKKDNWMMCADYAYNLPELVAKGIIGGTLLYAEVCGYIYKPNVVTDYAYRGTTSQNYPINSFNVFTTKISTPTTTVMEFVSNNMYKKVLQIQTLHHRGSGIRYIRTVNEPVAIQNLPIPPNVEYDGVSLFAMGGFYVEPITNLTSVAEYIPSYQSGGPSYDGNTAYNAFVHGNASLATKLFVAATDEEARNVSVRIRSIDLRSLSMVLTHQEQEYGSSIITFGTVAINNGDVVYDSTGTWATNKNYMQAAWLPENLISIYPEASSFSFSEHEDQSGETSANRRTIGAVQYAFAHTSLWQTHSPPTGVGQETLITTHPSGSWSACMDSFYGSYDNITVVVERNNGTISKKDTTHLTMFNLAYNQARTHSEYGYPNRAYGLGQVGWAGGWI